MYDHAEVQNQKIVEYEDEVRARLGPLEDSNDNGSGINAGMSG